MKMPEMEQTSKFTTRKNEFLKLTAGNHTVRLLPGDQGFYITHTHWVNGTNIECLDDECPICLNNKRIISQNPDNFRNVKGYSGRRQVFYINVLDKTLAKTCPACGEVHKPINGTFSSVCTSCNAVLVDVEAKPLNKVCILNRGVELYDNLKSINNSILNEETGEKIGIENFDIMLMVPPKTKRPVAQGLPHKTDHVDITEELYDLKTVPLQLSATEIKNFLSGTSLKDIFALRRAEENADTVVEDAEDEAIYEAQDIDDIDEVPFDVDDKKEEEDEIDLEQSVANLFNL